MVEERRVPVQPTGPRADPAEPADLTDLTQRLVALYERRLAPAFVRRVLEAEMRRSPAFPPGVVEDLVRRRLDDWLVFGRYPLPSDREVPAQTPAQTSAQTPVPGRWSRPDGT